MQSKEKENTKGKNQPKKNNINNFINKRLERASLFIENLKKDRQLLLITGCVVALFVAGILIIILNGSRLNGNAQTTAETTGNLGSNKAAAETVDLAEVLPQQRRDDGIMEDGTWTPVNQYVDPFAAPITLTGVAIGGLGGPMAIIESGGSSFIVKVGDYVDDLWAVLEIKREMVVLRAYNQEITLFFDQPPLTRMLDVSFGDEGQEEGS